MTTLLMTHRASLDHLTPPGHPERPDRIRAVDQVLAESRFDKLVRQEAPEGTLELARLCHDEHYIEELRRIAPDKGLIYLDGDTSMSPGTWETVMRSVGGAVAATAAVMWGGGDNSFPRDPPPGPPRKTKKADGLLLFRSCRDRGAPRPAQIRHRARRRGGFRRASWQRHPGYLLGRSDHDVLLDPPDAAVARHRRKRRARRARYHRQRTVGAR